jgi:hypothetical protein
VHATSANDVLVLYEHPEWQKPLFAALDLKRAAFVPGDPVPAKLVFNQASPSAYVRGNSRAVPFALAYLKALEATQPVVNGARAFALELSKTAPSARSPSTISTLSTSVSLENATGAGPRC